MLLFYIFSYYFKFVEILSSFKKYNRHISLICLLYLALIYFISVLVHFQLYFGQEKIFVLLLFVVNNNNNNNNNTDQKPTLLLFLVQITCTDDLAQYVLFSNRVVSKNLCFLAAPEVLAQKPYSNAVDCWSIGVITYIL